MMVTCFPNIFLFFQLFICHFRKKASLIYLCQPMLLRLSDHNLLDSKTGPIQKGKYHTNQKHAQLRGEGTEGWKSRLAEKKVDTSGNFQIQMTSPSDPRSFVLFSSGINHVDGIYVNCTSL